MTNSDASTPEKATKAAPIVRGQVIKVLPNIEICLPAGLYRVVWVSNLKRLAYLLRFPEIASSSEKIQIATPPEKYKKLRLRAPQEIFLDKLGELLQQKRCLLTEARLPMRYGRCDDDLTSFEKKTLESRRTIVADFRAENDLIRIFEYGQMGHLVANTRERLNKSLSNSEANPVTRDHIYQTVYRFWLYGWNDMALVGNSSRCGAPGKFRNPGTRQRGRPPKAIKAGHLPQDVDRNIDADTRQLMWIAWEAYAGKLGQYAAVYRKMVQECFCRDWEENDKGEMVAGTIAEKIPTLPAFRYYIKRRYDSVEVLRKIVPARSWHQTRKALRGKDFEHCFGPAHKFLIDATVADVYLVSNINRYWIIGRPIVYFVRDAWSGMIVGLHVALEGPSWETAKVALFNAFSPKGEFLQRYGFQMGDEAWPAAHGCMDLYHDRGEVLSIPSTDAAKNLGINLVACAAFSPEQKGSIETVFHWNNQAVVHWLPGAVRSRQRERGERDYRLDAKLTMFQFTRILIKAVLHFNSHQDVSDRLVGPLAGISIIPKPIHLWNWGLRNLHGSPIQWGKDELINAFLPSRKASLQADGIHCGDRRYSDASAAQLLEQIRARAFGNQSPNVRFDPIRPEILYVAESDGQSYKTISLANIDLLPEHTRDEEWIDYVELLKFEASERGDQDKKTIDRASLDALASKEIKQAKQIQSETQQPASKSERTKGIRENRRVEREFLAEPAPAVTHPPEMQSGTGTTTDTPAVRADIMSLLLANNK